MALRGLPPGSERTFTMEGFELIEAGAVFESPGGKLYEALEVWPTKITDKWRVRWLILDPADPAAESIPFVWLPFGR